jgi:hypothetical protein
MKNNILKTLKFLIVKARKKGGKLCVIATLLTLGQMICIHESKRHTNLEEDLSLNDYGVMTFLKFVGKHFPTIC